jgi:hypothetical protein
MFNVSISHYRTMVHGDRMKMAWQKTVWHYINDAKETARTSELIDTICRVEKALPKLCPECKRIVEEALSKNDESK